MEQITESESNVPNQNGRVLGHAHGIITDGNTGNVVANVDVAWSGRGTSGTVRTNANGFYSIPNLITGDYQLLVKPSNLYTSVKHDFSVPSMSALGVDAMVTNQDFHINLTENFTIFQKKSTVSGFVYASTSTTSMVPIANAKVIATLPSQYVPYYLNTLTDATGKFTFTDIPSIGVPVSFRVEGNYVIGDYTYSTGAISTITPTFNSVHELSVFTMSINTTPVAILSHNVNEYFHGQTIRFAFNKDINPMHFTMSITPSGMTQIPIKTRNWVNSRELIVTPDTDLISDTPHTFVFTGLATDKSMEPNFTITRSFSTTEFPLTIVSTTMNTYMPGGTFDIVFSKPVNQTTFNLTVFNFQTEAPVSMMTGTWFNEYTYRVRPTSNFTPNTSYRLMMNVRQVGSTTTYEINRVYRTSGW
jgi:hypothetical protein